MKTKVLQIKLWRNSNNSLEWEKSFQLQILNLQKEQIEVKSSEESTEGNDELGEKLMEGRMQRPQKNLPLTPLSLFLLHFPASHP